MATYHHLCVTDDDLAKASLFLLSHKRDLHPSYTTLEMVTLIYSYSTQGRLVNVTNDEHRVVGVAAYYHGTPEQEFQDKDIALIDVAIADKTYRGTNLFIRGLKFLVKSIIEGDPQVREIRLAALAENDYLCRLYAKFTKERYERMGTHGKEFVFCVKVNELKGFLTRFSQL
ncbi:hypothetical protein [Paenibacillus turpanensis]|uniref:hypothetical protein n=1 Tax=Paenibacillus turpanensis TaxID=2689078 RepID=UPI001409167F|nr:hypothetical protein [Paenibacillus turpanensis]